MQARASRCFQPNIPPCPSLLNYAAMKTFLVRSLLLLCSWRLLPPPRMSFLSPPRPRVRRQENLSGESILFKRLAHGRRHQRDQA